MKSRRAVFKQVVELASQGRPADALALLEAWHTERAREMANVRHDLGNTLSIAQSSVEAMIDGVVGITDARLNRVREILIAAGTAISALTCEDPDFGEAADALYTAPEDPIQNTIDAVSELAQMKGVRISYDPAGDRDVLDALHRHKSSVRTIQGALLAALRYTKAGGVVQIASNARGELTMIVPSEAGAEVLGVLDGSARLVADDGTETTLQLIV